MADNRLTLLKDVNILEVSNETALLTKHLLAKGLIPLKTASDAIAVASVPKRIFLLRGISSA